MKKVLCIDIGGSKILTGILNEKGEVLYRQKKAFDHPDRQQVIDSILGEGREVLANSCWKEKEDEEVSAIGVSIPGLADSEAGLWVYAPFSKIENLNVRNLLEEEFHKPVFLENDGNICAIGEKRFGCAKDVDDFMWVTISNGVGSGLYLNGRLYDGAFKSAGELGHVKVVDNGAMCPCGARGCLETYAAGPGIVRRYKERIGGGQQSGEKAKIASDGQQPNAQAEITAQEIAELAKKKDADAAFVFQEEGIYLGRAIAHAVNILNLPLVVLGGGIAASFELFRESMEKTLNEYLFLNANRNLKVCPTALGYEASLIGAGAVAFYGLEKTAEEQA